MTSKFTRKRLEILKWAATIFSQRGYHASSMTSIARALEMTAGNVYYYFRNKQQILYFCHEYSLNCLLESLQKVENDGSSPEAELHALIKVFVRVVVDELQGTNLILTLEPLSPSQYRKVCAKRDKFEKGVRRIVAAGMTSGVFKAGSAKLNTFVILGALNWISNWVDPHGPANADEIGEVFANHLVLGLVSGHGMRNIARSRISKPAEKSVARTVTHSTIPSRELSRDENFPRRGHFPYPIPYPRK